MIHCGSRKKQENLTIPAENVLPTQIRYRHFTRSTAPAEPILLNF